MFWRQHPRFFLIHTLRLRWKSFSRVLSTNQRQRQSSHDEDIQLESSTETGKPRRCRLFVYTVSENFDIDLICYELEPRPPQEWSRYVVEHVVWNGLRVRCSSDVATWSDHAEDKLKSTGSPARRVAACDEVDCYWCSQGENFQPPGLADSFKLSLIRRDLLLAT